MVQPGKDGEIITVKQKLNEGMYPQEKYAPGCPTVVMEDFIL